MVAEWINNWWPGTAFALYCFVREFWRFPNNSEVVDTILRDVVETGSENKANSTDSDRKK